MPVDGGSRPRAGAADCDCCADDEHWPIVSIPQHLPRADVVRLGAALLLLLAGTAAGRFPATAGATVVLHLLAYGLAGGPVLGAAVRNLRRGRWFDEHFLMSAATLGAIGLRQFTEAVAVMLLYSIGELLQEMAVGRSRRSISALLAIRPDRARVQRDGALVSLAPAAVAIGETILVYPGERIPLDGRVCEGESWIDTSPLTGEPLPRRAGPGDAVLAGTVNGGGVLAIRVERPFARSTVSRILELVEEATDRKARTQRLISRFSRVYTPGVVAAAALLATLPPLLSGAPFALWLERALVLLVIACPCALVLSVPLSYFAGIGVASRYGILIKGADFLDTLSRLHTVAFDKTGTLTYGRPRVVAIHAAPPFTAEEVIAAASAVEAPSSHPIARAILGEHSSDGHASFAGVSQFEELPGRGVRGQSGGRAIVVGNERLLHGVGIAHRSATCCPAEGIVHVAIDGTYAGHLRLADEIRADAAITIRTLRDLGVRRIGMLTGDVGSSAERVGRQLQLDEIMADLLPGEKVARLEAIAQAVPRGGSLAFVGDGINDAPVLRRADVGVALGGLGAEAAIEAADVVIMDDRLTKLPAAVEIAKRTHRIVVQNIGLAVGVKGLFTVLGALGAATIWGAVFADVGVTLLAVVNSLRVVRYRPRFHAGAT